MTQPLSYDVFSHGMMLRDRRRNEAYAEAIAISVREGDFVIDIGAGSGVFSMLAARAGARRVVALEPSESIELARLVITENALEDRIELVRDLSTNFSTDLPADVIISDLHGILPLFEHHLPSAIDARSRLLRPGGVMIPKRERIVVAPVDSADARRIAVGGWETALRELTFQSVLPHATSEWRKRDLAEDELLGEPATWAVLDYQTLNGSDVAGSVEWTVPRDASVHGFAVWFDSDLTDDIILSNRPGLEPTIYSQAFFPTRETITVEKGDHVELNLRATLLERDYLWEWRTVVTRGSVTVASFEQTNFQSRPLSLERLRKHAENYVPSINEDGRMQLLVLEHLSRGTELGGIASALIEAFPHRFASQRQALSFAGDLAERYA